LIITLNNLAKEYGLLPSEALGRATTFDLYVLDVSTRWLRYKQDVAEGKVEPKAKKQDLQWYMDLARREDSERKRKIAEEHNDQESKGS
jgi:hypothetical protein